MTSDRGGGDKSIAELMDDAVELYNDLSTVLDESGISSLGDDATRHSIDTPDPLREAHVNEDEVRIIAEMGTTNIGEVNLEFRDGEVVIKTEADNLITEIPEDVDKSSIEATMNSDVLIIEMDREQPEEMTVSVEDNTGLSMEGSDNIDGHGEEAESESWPDVRDSENGGDEDGSDE